MPEPTFRDPDDPHVGAESATPPQLRPFAFPTGQNNQNGEIHRRGPGKRRTPLMRKLFAEALMAPQERVVYLPPAPGKKRRTKVVQVVDAAMLKDLIARMQEIAGIARMQEIAADPRLRNRPQVLMLMSRMYDVFDAVVDAAERREGGFGPDLHRVNLVLSGPAAERLARAQLEKLGVPVEEEPEGEGGDGDPGRGPAQALLDDDGNELRPMEPMGRAQGRRVTPRHSATNISRIVMSARRTCCGRI